MYFVVSEIIFIWIILNYFNYINFDLWLVYKLIADLDEVAFSVKTANRLYTIQLVYELAKFAH